MHSWGHWPDEEFDKVNDAAEYIGEGLRRWFRVGVIQYKEKFGTVRVYCHLGWSAFYEVWRPGYVWVPTWWPWRLDLKISQVVMPLVNFISIPIMISGYRYFYKSALKKWPHLREEILCCADFPEYLHGL